MSLKIKYEAHPVLVIHRRAFRDKKLVYVIRASKRMRYPLGKSRIAYIGTTKKGARRVASSGARKGQDLLSRFGIKSLELNVVTCGKVQGVETWKMLERALIIRFRERFGRVPIANTMCKNSHWRKEKRYFTEMKLDDVIDGLS